MKRIISSSVMIFTVLAVVIGSTGAFFSDTETSVGNVFTAGSIDLKINHTKATYNGENCTENCTPVEGNLILNGSFENPVVTANGGGYEFFNSIPDWTKEVGTYVELQRTAFVSADGEQHVELDGDGANPATTISQSFVTTPGQKYRLTFEHSPRPNRPASDNAIKFEVAVVSPGNTIFSQTVQSGAGAINWQTYTYDFVADSALTTLRFSYDGTVNTHGGLLDNVVVQALRCESGYSNTPGGYCELWESKDLAQEKFFDFRDVKPQDSGSNLISMTVSSNEAYMCLNVANKQEQENGLIDPEAAAGDGTPGLLEGELGQFLHVVGWRSDSNGNKIGAPLFGPTKAANLGAITYADSLTLPAVQPNVTQYIHLEWCMGDMTLNGNVVTCNGNVPNINRSQTDAFLADLQFYAVQTRNNQNFTCAGQFPSPEQPPVLEPFSSEESE